LSPLALLAASLVVGLAGVVRMAHPPPSGAHDIAGVIRLPELVMWTIVTLFGLAGVILVVDIARRMRSRRQEEDEEDLGLAREATPRPAWLLALSQILTVVNFLVIVYLLWRNVIPLADLMAWSQTAGAAGVLMPERQPDAPFFVTWTFAVLALAAGCGALALALWITSSERLSRWGDDEASDAVPPPLVEAVEESLDDLRREPDARRAIIRCYARFERAAAASGLERRPWQTPMEFMRAVLARLPATRDAVRGLTSLFELARFSDRALALPDRDRAFDALDAIKAAIDESRPHAVAR
jgi:Domain of unknown function (DUF4129)